jgi:methenyltetrahydromethanopterin cyclohydrolase
MMIVLLHHQFVSIQAIQLRHGRGIVACMAAWQAGSDSVVGNVELRCIGPMQQLLLAVNQYQSINYTFF